VTLFGLYPLLEKLFADGGYHGPKFRAELAKLLPELAVEIVKRSDTAAGFKVLPRRWVVGTHIRLAQPVPSVGQGFQEPDPQRSRLYQAGIHQADAEKALQFQWIVSWRTLRAGRNMTG
jgi:transposase